MYTAAEAATAAAAAALVTGAADTVAGWQARPDQFWQFGVTRWGIFSSNKQQRPLDKCQQTLTVTLTLTPAGTQITAKRRVTRVSRIAQI